MDPRLERENRCNVKEKMKWEGEFTLRSDPWAGLIASCGSFLPMVQASIFCIFWFSRLCSFYYWLSSWLMGIEGDVVSCLYENASSWSRLCYYYLIGRRSRFLSFLVSCLELTSLFHSFSFLISQVFLFLSFLNPWLPHPISWYADLQSQESETKIERIKNLW